MIHRVECIPDVKVQNDLQALLTSALLCEYTTELAKLTFSISIPAETLLRVVKESIVLSSAVQSFGYNRQEQGKLRADARDWSKLRHQ